MQRKKDDGLNAIHVAASGNDVKLLDFIITNSPNQKSVINQKGLQGWTPAHLACLLGNFDSLNYLIEQGADLYLRNDNGIAPIEELVRSDHLELLKCVYKPQKKVMFEAGVYPLIHHAAGIEHSKCLQLFLNIGVQVNELSNEVDAATPLHFAVLSNCLGNVETLLSRGADINQCDAEGNTAMHFAVMTKSIEMVMLLDSKGGQADIANGEGETPIMMSMGD